MKKFIGIAAVLFVAALAPVTLANEVDITPETRDTSVIMQQLFAIQEQLNKVSAMMGAAAITSEATFTIAIDEEMVVSKPVQGMTRASAQAQCEAVAYNTDHMWKLVTCTFNGEVIYRDVFIAG